MEIKELKITIPEGFEIDEEESTFEKIVFKKKDTKPRSWEEYSRLMYTNGNKGYVILENSSIRCDNWVGMYKHEYWRSTLPSKELAEAFLAMMQLMSLRQAWIGDWEPDWDLTSGHYCIIIQDNEYIVDKFYRYHQPLSFPTKEMAEDFMDTFKDLLEIAKPLI